MSESAVNNSIKQRGRPFKPGASGNPRGRPKGSRNKRTRAVIHEAEVSGQELPLHYMLRVMRDPNAPVQRRDEMARAAAPYLHAKLAPAQPPIDFLDLPPARIESLTDDQLEALLGRLIAARDAMGA
jgi:hypothetical protein